MPSFGRTMSVRLVIIGSIVIIVPFFALLLFKMLMLMTLILDPAMCISAAEDVTQISIILVSPSATFLQWSETACRVPMRTLPVVMIMTLCLIFTVECRVHHGCYIEHRLESLDVSSNLLIVLWQVGGGGG
jgi:hypothetical protein